jgi:hypothetical protein
VQAPKSRRSLTVPEHVNHLVSGHLRALQKRPAKIRDSFHEPHTK